MRSLTLHRALAWASLGLLWTPGLAPAAAPSDLSQLDFFEKKIRPVLVESCYKCHSANSEKLRGGLLLDTREGVLKGGESGPAIVPGDPKKSLLITSIRHEHRDPDMAMPPKGDKLSDAVIGDFETWVKIGAPDPRSGPALAKSSTWDAAKAADHWAFKKVVAPAIPKSPDPKHFIQNPIDSFVLATLRAKKLQNSQKADKQTLIRRVTYDLTGLPPTQAEVEAFLADTASDAFEKVVDRLLESPKYGERWARHWLDIARYADTSGDRAIGRNRTPLYAYAWTYRDYVIKAFNEDLPYNQFIVEQLAADRLPESKDDKSRLAALGFLTIGKRFESNENDIIDDRIDVVTKGLMGLTGACARCHDHKFDPVPTRDYYALHGVFASCEEPSTGPALANPEANEAYQDYLVEVKKIEDELKDHERTEAFRLTSGMLERAGDYLLLYQESSKTTDNTKKGNNYRIAARDKGLAAEVAAVWADQLKEALDAHSKKKDPVLGPWLTLAALKPEEFGEKSPALLQEMKDSGQFNAAVLASLISKEPKSLKDAAEAYTEAFAGLHKTLGLPQFSGRVSKGFPVAKINTPVSDECTESLRKEVFSTTSMMVPDKKTISKTFGVTFTTTQARIQSKFAALDLSHAGAPIRAMTLVDRAKPKDSNVLIRGEALNRGPLVPRHFPTLLGGSEEKRFSDGSGRLEMAREIATRENPLTSRVFVNRVWQWHFGQGIVRTVSDFGTRSEPPTHPELLDWMASWFMDNGWSIKKLNKLIVMSSTYQQDSRVSEQASNVDPTNQWLSHFNIQRLDFEQVRDTLMTVSGELDDSEVGGRPFVIANQSSAVTRKAPTAADIGNLKTNPNRRTVYAMIDRAALPEVFNTFDFANPDMSTGERVLTTVPQQALFMMNSPFIAEQVRAIHERKDFPKDGADEDRVRFLYQAVYQRPPSAKEIELARVFLNSDPSTATTESASVLSKTAGSPAQKGATPTPKLLTPLERYTQVVLLSNELMYIR